MPKINCPCYGNSNIFISAAAICNTCSWCFMVNHWESCSMCSLLCVFVWHSERLATLSIDLFGWFQAFWQRFSGVHLHVKMENLADAAFGCSFILSSDFCPVPVHLCFYIWLFTLFVFLFLTVSDLPIVKYVVWRLAVYKVIYVKFVTCWSWETECLWNCCFVLSWFLFLAACVKWNALIICRFLCNGASIVTPMHYSC